jgi:hypothetical protein
MNPTTFRSEVMLIGPELAERFLASSPGNRKERSLHVKRLAESMKNGEWTLSSDAVAFDENNRLLNGHHRLNAVVVSGVSCPFWVVFGIRRKDETIIDGGVTRTPADHIGYATGLTQLTTIAAAIRYLVAFYENDVLSVVSTGYVTTKKIVDFSRRHEAELALVPDCSCLLGSRATNTTVFFLLRRIDSFAARRFYEAYKTGANLPAGSPILALRSYAYNNKSMHSNSSRIKYLAVAFKAWIHWRNGRSIKLLRWGAREPFPLTRDDVPQAPLFPSPLDDAWLTKRSHGRG